MNDSVPASATGPGPALQQPATAPRKTGRIISLLAALLVVIGGFGLLSVPMMLMFTEGLPDSVQDSPGLYVTAQALFYIAFIAAGVGVARGREWGRLLAMGVFVYVGIAIGSILSMAVGAGLALLLAVRWRPGSPVQGH